MAREPLASRCENCRYFGKNERIEITECRRRAPRGPMLVGEHGYYTFPPVQAGDWCGEYIGNDGFLFVSPNELPREIEEVPF